MKKVLITGASGLIGKKLTTLLLKAGYEVNHLGRSGKTRQKGVNAYKWNIETGEMDAAAFDGVTGVVHLAGANLADSRWTDSRKKELIDSRVKSCELIYNHLKSGKHTVSSFISASAVGYYGDCGSEIVTEEHAPGKEFVSEICKAWEYGAVKIGKLGIREVRCRIGIVLAKEGGALPELMRTLPVGVAGYFAKADLYYPWVHVNDVCGIVMHALENPAMKGPYNTTAPKPLLIKELMKEIVEAANAKAVLMPVPAFGLKLALGEMAEMLLVSQNTSADKIEKAGYSFNYPHIKEALKNILK